MEQKIIDYRINEELLRVLKVEFDDFNNLHFFRPKDNYESFLRITDLYRDVIVKNYSYIFGTLVLFKLSPDINIKVPKYDKRYGLIFNKEAVVKILFKDNIRLKKGKLEFLDDYTEELFNHLKNNGYLKVVKGQRKYLAFLPVGELGFMSKEERKELRVNSNFFTMDLFDLGSPLDRLGVPVGLCVKKGRILIAPSFDREVLVCRKEKVSIEKIKLNDIKIIIDDKVYSDNLNAQIYERPKYKLSKKSKMDLVIIDGEIVAIKKGGRSIVPSGGFVLGLNEEIEVKNRKVKYRGLEDVDFALQVGNSVVRNGETSKKFYSKFYNIYHLIGTAYPPSLYPLNYQKDRAARIVLGFSKDNKPILLWFEGKPKFGYNKGVDSIGSTLKETADIAKELGIYNGINLDGGGSAEILINGEKPLKLADRELNGEEKERGIPIGLFVV